MTEYDNNLVVIDADSLVYIIGYKFKDIFVKPLGISALDDFIKNILQNTKSRNYLGFFGAVGGKNFRHDIAVTKKYKGNRDREKDDYLKFWEPILKHRMETYWKFVPVKNIEADDACNIAVNANRKKFKNITVATTDKDLVQIPNIWFYDYKKSNLFYCGETIANRSLYLQLIMGDSADNIQGCDGIGATTANKYYDDINKINVKKINQAFYIEKAKEIYHDWYTIILKDKILKKLEKEYLTLYKVNNEIKRFTADIKSIALENFKPDLSSIIKTSEEIDDLFEEMYSLIKLLDTKKEGKKYGFILSDSIKENVIDWKEIIAYEENLNSIPDADEEIDLLDDL